MTAEGLRDERIAPLGPAAPVDRILEPARDAAVVFRRHEQERLGLLERLLERLRRRGIVRVVVVAVERQVPDRDLGEREAARSEAHERLRELAIDGASREAADDVTDFVRGHGFLRPPLSHVGRSSLPAACGNLRPEISGDPHDTPARPGARRCSRCHASAAEVERVTRGNLAIEGIPEIPQELIQRLRRYQYARGASFAGWTPDGRITDQHAVRQHEPAARRRHADGRAPADHLLRRARERRQLVADRRAQGRRLHPRLGRQRELPARVPRPRESRTRCGSPTGAAARTRACGRRTARSTRSSGRRGPASQPTSTSTIRSIACAPELVFEAPAVGWNAADWSPDGKSLLLIHFVSANESYLWIYDLATREKREIEPSKVKAAARRKFLARRQGRVFHVRPRQRVPHAALRRPRDGQGHAAHRSPEVGRGQLRALARRSLPRLRRQRGRREPARRHGPRAARGPGPAASCRSASSARWTSIPPASGSPSACRRRRSRTTSGSGRSRTASSSAGPQSEIGPIDAKTLRRADARALPDVRQGRTASRARSRPGCTSPRARARTRC